MKIRFFMLGDKDRRSNLLLSSEIKNVFAEYLTDNGSVMIYPAIKDATTDIAKAFSDSHAVVFLVEDRIFAESKSVLAKAFSFELKVDEQILGNAIASENHEELSEEDFAFKHAAVPVGTRRFALNDGLLTGFSVVSGNQTIIFLPLERIRTLHQLTTQVIPYLNSIYHINVDISLFKSWHLGKLESAIERESATVALSNTKAAPLVTEWFSKSDFIKNLISVTPSAEKRGDLAPEEYVKNLSITAAELQNCSYGIAVSNIFYSDDDAALKTVYVAITNERETQVRKFTSVKDESVDDFINSFCLSLCVFFEDILDTDENFGKYVRKKKKKVVNQYRALITVIAVLLAAVIAAGAFYFSMHDYSVKDWLTNAANFLFPREDSFDAEEFTDSETQSYDSETSAELTTAEISTDDSSQTQTDATGETQSTHESETGITTQSTTGQSLPLHTEGGIFNG